MTGPQEETTFPPTFTAAWRRRSIALDGGAPHESEHVMWVQAGTRFVDLRLPLDGVGDPVCFSGTTAWDPPTLRWSHDIDLDAGPGADEGTVEWSGGAWGEGDLVERGQFGAVAYEEVWERLPLGETDAVEVLERSDGRGRLVRVGDHALVAADDRPQGELVARYDVLDGGTWHPVRSLGAAGGLPTPDGAQGWFTRVDDAVRRSRRAGRPPAGATAP